MSVPNSLILSVLISMLSPKKDVASCTSSSFNSGHNLGIRSMISIIPIILYLHCMYIITSIIYDQYIPIYLHCMYVITSIIYM